MATAKHDRCDRLPEKFQNEKKNGTVELGFKTIKYKKGKLIELTDLYN